MIGLNHNAENASRRALCVLVWASDTASMMELLLVVDSRGKTSLFWMILGVHRSHPKVLFFQFYSFKLAGIQAFDSFEIRGIQVGDALLSIWGSWEYAADPITQSSLKQPLRGLLTHTCHSTTVSHHKRISPQSQD